MPRLLTRDENMEVQPLLATMWEQDENGIRLTLHPNASCQNGERLDAQAVATNIQAFLGNIEGFSGRFLANTLDGLVDDPTAPALPVGPFCTAPITTCSGSTRRNI